MPNESAEGAGLVHVSDLDPGLARSIARGRGSPIETAEGRAVRDRSDPRDASARLRSPRRGPTFGSVQRARAGTCKPPAVTSGGGSSTATTRSGARRGTGRSMPGWSRSAERCPRFGRAWRPTSSVKGLPREKVLALVVRLLESTMIRVGNEEYARSNHSFGLTTLRDSHAKDRGGARRPSPFGERAGSATRSRWTTLGSRRLVKAVPRPAGARALPVPRRGGDRPRREVPRT